MRDPEGKANFAYNSVQNKESKIKKKEKKY